MSGEFLATRLAACRACGPKRTLWWPQHARLLSICMDGRRASIPSVLRSKMLEDAREWTGFSSPSLGRLAAEHVGLELSLIQGARSDDAQQVNRAGDLLGANAEEQANLLSRSIKEFPKVMFMNLLKEHVALVAKALQYKADRDKEGLSICLKKQTTNTFRLAAFTTEWF